MKKKILILTAVLLLIALGVGLWFYGYHHRKNPDNLPSKAFLAQVCQEEGEAYASELLEGYTLGQLTYVWGEPQGQLSGLFGRAWDLDDTNFLLVYFYMDRGYGAEDAIVKSVKVSQKQR